MSKQPEATHAQIIEAFGGSAKFARLLSTPDSKVPAATVRAWIRRGIPAKVQLKHSSLMRKGRKLAEVSK